MLNLFAKIKYLLKKPKIVIITGSGRKTAAEAVFRTLEKYFKVKKIQGDFLPFFKEEILIFETGIKDMDFYKFLVKNSKLPVLLITHFGEYYPDKEFFSADISQVFEASKLAEFLPANSFAIFNFDDETVREIKNKTKAHPLTFGFGARSDIRVTDIVLTEAPSFGTNFKINHEGSIIPVWLENLFGKEHIYSALCAAAAGEVLDLNFVEVSEALKLYKGFPGKMKLIPGIKKSFVLDNSENVSSFSMAESVEVLGDIKTQGRKIAVLGDISGVGKYTIEAHEAIGERVVKKTNLLFTLGQKAKFISEGAKRKGMPIDNIFNFGILNDVKSSLRDEIREGDLILVSGSKETGMSKIVEEIKK
ncbi:MAG: Mur ligase family protein [Candidatus Nealsonbacteria bacterium]